MQALRTGSGIRDGLVKELDSDAMNKGDGRSLTADDGLSQIIACRSTNRNAIFLRKA
ncbi:hypothetical protein DEU56DRAFT_795136 [Suillus clintonianus]|uniref:uncharacterized protein n=1 Tax=Suillus clintonianus TaxID=1904413 RepID=UPI001B87B991|nr:uncharacterized protein DEU56DRAFT_795136 [Suillus clintonianus]KAG2141852.1 hypothetical protein DEU56DRAFT_795136 [Suillus clintonianus]